MFVFVKKDIWIKLLDVLQALSLDISNYLHPFNYDYTSLYILKRQQQILEKHMIAILLPIFLSYNFPYN